ncbi:MAG: M20/M25/M40 family metallo-hydrolase [Candidatus Zixiibacteriota bacterium]|nr:MAG: M20/M25/M40 family metallo-hydrolase [candidate division Zixibacteria bacterium]
MVNAERLKSTFLDLVRIDSHSREEGEVARYIQNRLTALGLEATMDEAGAKIGGNCGNLFVRLQGPLAGKVEPILFCSHMDTVVPGKGVKPVEVDGVFRSSGDTILGADDKSGIAAILELVQVLKENDKSYGEIELLFTVAEEIGLVGARHFDTAQLKSRHAYFLDSEFVTSIGVGAPSAYRMTYRIHGLEAHAGMAPERGISAIRVAAQAINAMPLGRIDFETTANIGSIEGGAATNIIPKLVTLRGEARSHNPQKLEAQAEAMRRAFDQAVENSAVTIDGERVQARLEEERNLEYQAFRVAENSLTYRLAAEAGADLGLKMEPEISGGGSDANIFNAKGIESVVLGTGMMEPHTVKEFLRFEDMLNATRLIVNMVYRLR